MHRLIYVSVAAATLVAAAPAITAVNIERNSATLEFSYSWPAQAAAITPLDRRFRANMATALRSAQATARDEQKLTREQKRPFNRQYFAMAWTSTGQSKRLLSLQYDLGEFTGGAHPNSNNGVLLWDRALAREIAADSLFARSGGLAAATRANYCKALDAERLKRREGEKLDGMFSACPKFSEVAIAPVDTNQDGRFDMLDFTAAPYTAGPYVEGEYAIALPVTAALIAALKPQYRASFAAQRQ
ncbi:MAG: DUF4163 domain-containing protein [Sphingomicrobium sp.]